MTMEQEANRQPKTTTTFFSDSVSWSVDDGVLVVVNPDATPSLEFPLSPSNYLEYFDEETVLQILAADEEGYSAQWRIEKKARFLRVSN